MTVPASLAGLPAVSLPVGLGTETGLPVGVQVIAARGNDADALGFAMRLEARVAAARRPGGGRRTRGGGGRKSGRRGVGRTTQSGGRPRGDALRDRGMMEERREELSSELEYRA